MPITALDPRTALVVIDLQKGITARQLIIPADEIITNNAKLVDAFRTRNLPVVRVRVSFSSDRADALSPRADASTAATSALPEGWDELDSRVPLDPSDIVITKRQWGAFYGTELDLQLRRRGVTGIVLTGIATTYGVESTARTAFELGYQLTFVTDAITDMNQEAHDCAFKYVFSRIGESGTTTELLETLQTI